MMAEGKRKSIEDAARVIDGSVAALKADYIVPCPCAALNLLPQQEPLGTDFERVWDENTEKLYES
jgi:hypothetical protein